MSALINGYLDEDQGRVFEDEDFAEEKFFAGAEAYAVARAEQEAGEVVEHGDNQGREV